MMKHYTLLLLLSLAGCGRQVVEFGTDTGAVAPDATADAGADARPDPIADAALDSAADAMSDATLDATADATADATLDATGDATVDATAVVKVHRGHSNPGHGDRVRTSRMGPLLREHHPRHACTDFSRIPRGSHLLLRAQRLADAAPMHALRPADLRAVCDPSFGRPALSGMRGGGPAERAQGAICVAR